MFCWNGLLFMICGPQVRCIRPHEILLLLLLGRFNCVQLCAVPLTAAHQAPRSLGFSRQEHWSGLPFSSPIHESEKWKWSCSVVSDSSWPHGLQPTRLLCPWDFPGKSTGVGCHHFSATWDERASIIFHRHYVRFLSGIWIHIKLVCNKIKVGYEYVWRPQVQTVPSSKGETPVPRPPFPDGGHSLASLSMGWVLS